MDEDAVLRVVQQYLHERGFPQALAALSAESGVEFDNEDGSLERGGQLLSLIAEHAEFKAALEGFADTEGELSEKREAEEELLRTGTPDACPKQETACVGTLHAGNLIACRYNCDSTLIATGSADRTVKISDAQTRAEAHTVSSHAAPILSVCWSPTEPHILVSTAMDGTCVVTDATSGSQLAQFKDHQKYAHRCSWAPNGRLFAVCGHDKKVSVYKKNDGGDGFALLRQREMVTLPEAMCFLDDSATLVVSCRDDNYFHYLDTGDGTELKVNMNALGDDHVSFTVLDLVLSPNGKTLLASTDRSRLILFVVGTCHQLRNYYGAVNDQLCQTRACFHPSGRLIYCTSQDQKIYCWDTVTQKVSGTFQGHSGVVRDVDVSTDGSSLITCSFDKTLRVWS